MEFSRASKNHVYMTVTAQRGRWFLFKSPSKLKVPAHMIKHDAAMYTDVVRTHDDLLV